MVKSGDALQNSATVLFSQNFVTGTMEAFTTISLNTSRTLFRPAAGISRKPFGDYLKHVVRNRGNTLWIVLEIPSSDS